MKETEAVATAAGERSRELKLVNAADNVQSAASRAPSDWLKVGTVAAASALLGGLAAAWFYRKTLSRLREAGNEIPESRITEDGSAEDF